jgi:hypothetical protein
MNIPRCTAMLAATLFSSVPALAGLSQSAITAPGGFVQSAGFLSTSGGGFVAGADLYTLGTEMDAHEVSFTGVSSASVSSSVSSGSTSNSASGDVGMGYARMYATNTCPNSTFFAVGAANGGWKEDFTVSSPSLNGQAGYMVFQIRVRGTISVAGFAGAAGIYTTGYKNNTELMANAYWDRGPSDAISTDRQRTQWALSSAPDATRTFDGVVTMAVPITFGQSFTLGVYAVARAGQRSSSGVGGLSTGTIDATGGGVTWNGITSIITAAGAPVADASVAAASGVNWGGPWSPCGNSDFNGDGDFGTDADIESFFACLAGNCCPTCWAGGADFNGDGDFGTDADIEAFFRVLAGGNC